MNQRPDILCPHCRRINPRRVAQCRFCGRDLTFVEGDVRYSLVRIIKTGGQAVIFEAIDDVHPRAYAIKEIVLPLDAERASEAFQRCAIEARLLATLSHPGIPRFYHSLIKDGRVYIVMDLVKGTDLEDILRQRGRLPERTVLSIANQVCDILHYLHTQPTPVIFRDVKPSNIMLDSDGLINMIDFGIARFTNSQKGNSMGTPGYAPPEQYRGDVTPVSDIYALGATMHHLLSGRDPRGQKPFAFPDIRELNPEISQYTAAIVQQALQHDAEQRFGSVLDMRNAIRAVMRGEETTVLHIISDTAPIPTRPMIPADTPVPVEIDYETQVIIEESSLDPTRELSFQQGHMPATEATTLQSDIFPLDPSPAEAVAQALQATQPPPARSMSTPVRTLLFVVIASICGLSVWSAYAHPIWWQTLGQRIQGQYQHWMGTDVQRITQELTVTVAVDQDINVVFAEAFATSINTTYANNWQYLSPPQFLAQPPELIRTNDDGSALYTGWMHAEIRLLP